jgi:hypothetical protein
MALLLCLVIALAGGCRTVPLTSHQGFDFDSDTFAYPNELVWEYGYDEKGKWRGQPRSPKPEYTHRCFVIARATKQFFYNARFESGQPPLSDEEYRDRVRRVVDSSPRKTARNPIVIPGYADLRAFSAAHAPVLKQECGGPWQSYFQRGHWRMLFPFSRSHQLRAARRLAAGAQSDQPAVVHLVCFPSLRINHAVVVYDVNETTAEYEFAVYDPNHPERPATLTFSRKDRRFTFPANDYFPGGKVNVYQVFTGPCY